MQTKSYFEQILYCIYLFIYLSLMSAANTSTFTPSHFPYCTAVHLSVHFHSVWVQLQVVSCSSRAPGKALGHVLFIIIFKSQSKLNVRCISGILTKNKYNANKFKKKKKRPLQIGNCLQMASSVPIYGTSRLHSLFLLSHRAVTGVHMIDAISSFRLSSSPDEQIPNRLLLGECVKSLRSQECEFLREQTLNGDFRSDLQSVDLSVRSHQISSSSGVCPQDQGRTNRCLDLEWNILLTQKILK